MSERRRHRRVDRLALVVNVLAVVLVLYATVRVQTQGDRLDGQQQRLAAAERHIGSEYTATIETCERLQILRVEDNISHFADWRVFRVVSIESHSQAAMAHVPADQREGTRKFLRQLDAAVREKTWVPLTNCAEAVNREGLHYKPPRPVPFSVRLPPIEALTLPPGVFR